MLTDFLILFLSVGIAMYLYSIFEKKQPDYDHHHKPIWGAIFVGLASASINSFFSMFF